MGTDSDPLDTVIAQFDSLSTRAKEVFAALNTSMIEREVAQALGISRNTVHGYVKRIYVVMRVHSRAELMAIAGDRPDFAKRLHSIVHNLPKRVRSDHGLSEHTDVEITLRIDRKVLAALRQHIDNPARHLAELARREAARLINESART